MSAKQTGMKCIYSLLLLLFPLLTQAQRPAGQGQAARNGGQMPRIGRVYGKIVDAQTNKPVEFATVGILNAKDSAVVAGMLTQGNGDFNIESLPFGQFILRVNFIGYEPYLKNFFVTPKSPEQDLGNFKIRQATKTLKEAVVTADKSTFTMGIDKKIFNVSKSLASKGGTATDALRQVPTVNVDIDGNVSLRNGSPTIFVDGKKTPLTLDQIPADQIESIEIITNPSAKYDAEGMSGIINIVLKKDRKPGINGMVMAGAGTHDQYNGGVNMNIYKKPLNLSLNYFANSRPRISEGTNERKNLFDQSFLSQNSHETSKGLFQVGRIGLDYFIDNRNTISLSGGIGGGHFKSNGSIHSDYLNTGKQLDSSNVRETFENHNFQFLSSDLNYTHNFAKEKEQLTVEGNLRRFSGPNDGNYTTHYYDLEKNTIRDPSLQQYTSNGHSNIVTLQSDYTNPLRKGKARLEAGIKTTIVDSRNVNTTLDYDYATKTYARNPFASYNYDYNQQTYAAYTNYSDQIGKFGYQAGLRFEQYNYKGEMIDSAYSFSYKKPGLFPSIFLSQKIGKNQELQLNYSRRVDRPSFWQISPRIDYEDPQNLRKGNPELQPEYTNSFELSYNNVTGGSNVLATLYFRNTNNLITSYVESISSDTLLTTFINADHSNSFGAELTGRTPLTNWWDVTGNLNLYRTQIQASNISQHLSNSGFGWYAKLNSETRLPANFMIQLTGEYEGPRVIPQGKLKGSGSVDIAVRKDFFKNRAASLTLALSDIFDTERRASHTESAGYFIEDATRNRLSRIFRINFSYRFGKQDFQLFKRRSKSQQGQGQDNMMMGPDDQ